MTHHDQDTYREALAKYAAVEMRKARSEGIFDCTFHNTHTANKDANRHHLVDRVRDYLSQHPGSSLGDIQRALEKTAPSTTLHLVKAAMSELQVDGLVTYKDATKGCVRYRAWRLT